MKHVSLFIAALFTVTACATKPPVEPTKLALDHFNCYFAGGRPVQRNVILKDQFGKEQVQVSNPAKFCNPVKKILRDKVTPILHPDHHLVFYKIQSHQFTVPIPVFVDNQFGDHQKIMAFQPLYLAVPTHKLSPGRHSAPEGLDHFKCYRAEGDPIETNVGLQDQFVSSRQVGVHKPLLLCNPAVKEQATHASEVLHPSLHLMCYQTDVMQYAAGVKIRNQFGEAMLKVKNADMLCVPSLKHRIRP